MGFQIMGGHHKWGGNGQYVGSQKGRGFDRVAELSSKMGAQNYQAGNIM